MATTFSNALKQFFQKSIIGSGQHSEALIFSGTNWNRNLICGTSS